MGSVTEQIPLVLTTNETSSSIAKCISLVEDSAHVKFAIERKSDGAQSENVLKVLQDISASLKSHDKRQVVGALEEVVHRCIISEDFGGYGMNLEASLSSQQEADIVFLCSAYLEALKSASRAQRKSPPLKHRPSGRRGMTVGEKIFAMHDISRKGYVQPGDIIQVDVDWVLASELSWAVRFAW